MFVFAFLCLNTQTWLPTPILSTSIPRAININTLTTSMKCD